MKKRKLKSPTLAEFKEFLIASVVADIVNFDSKTFKEASDEFLESKTCKIIKNAGDEYDHEDPEYFYDMWRNEVTIGRPVTSDQLEIEKLIKEGKTEA